MIWLAMSVSLPELRSITQLNDIFLIIRLKQRIEHKTGAKHAMPRYLVVNK